jgi:hypothetical protein
MEKRPPYSVNILRDTLRTKAEELEKEPAPNRWPIFVGVAVILVAAGVAANLLLSGSSKKEEVHPSKFEKKLLATVEVRDVPPPPPAIKEVENRTANKSAEEKRMISELLKGKKLIPTLDTKAEKKATKVVTVTRVKMRLIHNPVEKARALKVLKMLNIEDASVRQERTLVTFRRVLVGPFKSSAEIKKAKELITDSIQEEFSFWVKRKKKGKYLAVQAFVQEKNSDSLVLALAQLGFNPVIERFNRQIPCYKLEFTVPPDQRWSYIKKKLEANQVHIIDYRVYPKQVTRPVEEGSTSTISQGSGS